MVQTFTLRCSRSSGTAEQGQLHRALYVPNATKLYTFKKIILAVQRGFQDLSSLTGDGTQISHLLVLRKLQNPSPKCSPLYHRHPLGRPLEGSSFPSFRVRGDGPCSTQPQQEERWGGSHRAEALPLLPATRGKDL